SQQQLATLRTRARWSNTPVAMHDPTAPAGALPQAVRTLARSSTTAVEPGLIVLMLQAAYLGGDHHEVACADENGPTRGAVMPAPPVWNPGVVVFPEPFRRIAEISHQFVESPPVHAACDCLGMGAPVSSGHDRPVVRVTMLFDKSVQVLR